MRPQEVFTDAACRSLWDKGYEGGSVVETLGPSTLISRAAFKFPFPAKPRDICILTHVEVEQDGVVWIFSRCGRRAASRAALDDVPLRSSVEHANCPPRPSHVRAQLAFAVTEVWWAKICATLCAVFSTSAARRFGPSQPRRRRSSTVAPSCRRCRLMPAHHPLVEPTDGLYAGLHSQARC